MHMFIGLCTTSNIAASIQHFLQPGDMFINSYSLHSIELLYNLEIILKTYFEWYSESLFQYTTYTVYSFP